MQCVSDREWVHPVGDSPRKPFKCQFQLGGICDEPVRYEQRRKGLNLTRLYWGRGSRAKALSS